MKEITFLAKHYLLSAYLRDFIRVNWLKKFFVALFIMLLTGFNSWSQSITVDGDPGDWEILEASDPAVFTHIEDPFGTGVIDNQFTEGSKDYNIAADLVWADGQTKAKNDIANALAYLDGTTLYFAGDKTSNNGDAQIGFWFYLNNTAPRVLQTSPTRGGDFYPEHADGDILVLIDFTGGGKFGTVTSYVWVGVGEGAYGNNNSLDLLGTGTVAQNNLSEFPVPDGWSFTSETYDQNQFFEGSIDLATLDISDACFSRFLVEARSSQELTASLDDFAAGEFNVEPQASVNDITACENDGPFILTATADGGLGTLAYEWRKLPSTEVIGTASTFEVTESGQYSVIILGQGVFGGKCPSQPAIATVLLYESVDAGTDGTDRFCEGDAVNGVVNLFEIITLEDAGGSWADTDDTGVDISDPTSVDLSGLGDGIYVFTYTVTPTGDSTCPPDSSTATITIDDPVDAGTDGTDRFCEGDAVNGIVNLFEIITLEDTGGSWADTDGTAVNISDPTSVDLSTLGDGVYVFTYTVTPATGSTCPPDSSTATITIDDSVDAGTDGTDRFCEGDAVNGIVNLFEIITLEDTGGSWADTDGTGVDISDPTSIDLSTLGDGVYVFTYTVTPATGSTCPPDSSTATITIDDSLDAGTDGTDRFCEGDAVNGIVNLFEIITLEDTGGSWADTDGTGVNISDPTSVNLSTLGDGVYVFTYTVTPATGSTCLPDSSTATITIDPLPVAPNIQTQLADCIGGDGSAALTYDDPGITQFYYRYKDANDAGAVFGSWTLYTGVISLQPGSYTFEVKYTEDGCISDEFTVNINKPQDTIVTLTPEVTQPDCATFLGAIEISNAAALGDLNYTVYNQANPTVALTNYDYVKYPTGGFTGLGVGTYLITAVSNNGCEFGSVEVTLVEPQCVECETAFGKDDDGAAICFEDVPDAETLIPNETRWGWTNLYSFGGGIGEDVNTLNLYQGAAHCEDGTFVGTVTLTRTGNTLSVEFEASANYYFGSIHLYVGGEPFMYKKQGKNYTYTVAPGQYNQNPSSLPSEYVTEYTINGIVLTGDYYVIAHVDACTSEYSNINEDNISSAIAGIYEPKPRFATMLPAIDDGKTVSTTSSLSETSEPLFTIAPVPFRDVLNIGYLFDYTSDVTIQVFDLNGRLLATYNDTAVNSESISTFSVDFRTKAGQIYIVRMTTASEVYTAKIIADR